MDLPKAIHELEYGQARCTGRKKRRPWVGAGGQRAFLRTPGKEIRGDVRRLLRCAIRLGGDVAARRVSSSRRSLPACEPGDEVITTPISWISTANAAAVLGAKIVFADVDPRTLNLDPASVLEKITERTKAIIVVHLYGQCCDMDPIMEVAREREYPGDRRLRSRRRRRIQGPPRRIAGRHRGLQLPSAKEHGDAG